MDISSGCEHDRSLQSIPGPTPTPVLSITVKLLLTMLTDGEKGRLEAGEVIGGGGGAMSCDVRLEDEVGG